MRKQGKIRTRAAGTVLAAAAVAALAMPATAQAAEVTEARSTTASAAATADVGIMASWRTIATYRTSFGCQGEKASLELSTPWTLRCQSAGLFTYHLQRYY